MNVFISSWISLYIQIARKSWLTIVVSGWKCFPPISSRRKPLGTYGISDLLDGRKEMLEDAMWVKNRDYRLVVRTRRAQCRSHVSCQQHSKIFPASTLSACLYLYLDSDLYLSCQDDRIFSASTQLGGLPWHFLFRLTSSEEGVQT